MTFILLNNIFPTIIAITLRLNRISVGGFLALALAVAGYKMYSTVPEVISQPSLA